MISVFSGALSCLQSSEWMDGSTRTTEPTKWMRITKIARDLTFSSFRWKTNPNFQPWSSPLPLFPSSPGLLPSPLAPPVPSIPLPSLTREFPKEWTASQSWNDMQRNIYFRSIWMNPFFFVWENVPHWNFTSEWHKMQRYTRFTIAIHKYDLLVHNNVEPMGVFC